MHSLINRPGDDPLLTEVDAARVLSLSSRTLQAWRAKPFGPRFIRVGRAIRYRRQDIEEWVSEQTVRPTSARYPGAGEEARG